MCKAGTLIIDNTKLKANASAERSKNKEQYEHWLERIDGDIKNILNQSLEHQSQPGLPASLFKRNKKNNCRMAINLHW